MNDKHGITHSISVKEYIRRKALGLLGLIESGIDPRDKADRLTFVNDIDEVLKTKLKEYNVWYSGDSDELLNFYTRANSIDYNTDPLLNRNKKGYFWSVASTEGDIKRSHSGQPRNIVDTLVNIIGIPDISVTDTTGALSTVSNRLKEILDENNFNRLLIQKARPMTLVEGWGAFKINWDTSFMDTPILLYYRADAVDFVFKSNQLLAIIYRDYYQDEKKKNYILFETRRLEKRTCTVEGPHYGQKVTCLIIEKDLFEIKGQSNTLEPVKLTSLPQLADVKEKIIIEDFKSFLGCPCIIYEDNTEDCYGRSIFTGKIDLFDDLDQCHSQAANAVRRSTVHEYFDTQYLEKDENTGAPIMPKDFDRKYVLFKGGRGSDGQMNGQGPVQVTQPAVNFQQYSTEEQNILIHIISGVMSPATLGIDIAKKDNAEAQREKEKVTIFTRNTIIAEEGKWLKKLCNDLLIADELMRTGTATCHKYNVQVKYDEFADASFEAKLESIIGAWQSGLMSDEMAIDYLYKDTITEDEKQRELDFIKKQREEAQGQQQAGQMNPEDMGMFGEMGADNAYNEAMQDPANAVAGLSEPGATGPIQ